MEYKSRKSYHAAMATPFHLTCLRSELCNLPATDSAELEMVIKALAFRRSIAVKNRLVAKGCSLGLGSKANIGSKRGA